MTELLLHKDKFQLTFGHGTAPSWTRADVRHIPQVMVIWGRTKIIFTQQQGSSRIQ